MSKLATFFVLLAFASSGELKKSGYRCIKSVELDELSFPTFQFVRNVLPTSSTLTEDVFTSSPISTLPSWSHGKFARTLVEIWPRSLLVQSCSLSTSISKAMVTMSAMFFVGLTLLQMKVK